METWPLGFYIVKIFKFAKSTEPIMEQYEIK